MKLHDYIRIQQFKDRQKTFSVAISFEKEDIVTNNASKDIISKMC